MPVVPEVFDRPDQLGSAAAASIVAGLRTARAAGRPFLLGCPGGRSATSTYRALAATVAAEALDLGHLVVVMMDDYVVTDAGGAPRHEDATALHSCIRFGREEIVAPLDAAAGPGRGIGSDGYWVPDPSDPGAYDARIAAAGGIDLFLLASGAGDGHVAFNTPGAAADSRTRVVDLPDSTRRDNLVTFPSFGGRLAAVPSRGVTVGIATIVEQSRSVIMLAHGADKGRAAQRLLSATGYDPDWPATVFAECARPRLLLDAAALAAAPTPSRS